MAHLAARSGYQELVRRLNKSPQGATPSRRLNAILQILMTEKEAALVARVPLRPFTVETAARAWRMKPAEAEKTLDSLASRALLVDSEWRGRRTFVLPPPMAGFFEFSMMRLRDDVDQKLLAKLYYEYITVEEDFIKALFTEGETQLGRTFVNEAVLTNENALHVLDYERSSEVVRSASHRAIGLCYCRHKMAHVGRACDAPLAICMTFNATAASLIRHGYARAVDVSECLDRLAEARGRNLVQFGENIRHRPSFICNCCGCCCEAMIAQRRFGLLHPIHTTNFLPVVDCRPVHGLRGLRRGLPGRGHGPGIRERSALSEEEESHGGRDRLPWLRRLRRGLSDEEPVPGLAARAGHHAAQFGP